MSHPPVIVTVFGLGEAGSPIASDLAAQEVKIRGYDPAPVDTPPGVRRSPTPQQAVSGAAAVLALTAPAASDAPEALRQALDVPHRAIQPESPVG